MAQLNLDTHLYTASQVCGLDSAAIAGGIPGYALMQRAALAAFTTLKARWPQALRIGILAGSGNNGGDAFLVGQLAREAGCEVIAIALSAESTGDAAQAREAYLKSGGEVRVFSVQQALPKVDVWVDGLFGTGLSRAPEGVAAWLIEQTNNGGVPILALDLPSGLLADYGTAPGVVIKATATISFVGWKRGLFTADGPDLCGALELASLDIADSVYAIIAADVVLLETKDLSTLLPTRSINVNKGNFGHVLAIGGDFGMAGAVCLAAQAALRVGAGVVSVATRAEHITALNAARPEVMAQGVDGPQMLAAMLERASVIALGPGLGQGAWGHALWDTALESNKPGVLDADALNLLAINSRALSASIVLTPHPGEAARLLGLSIERVQNDRFAAVRDIAARYGAVTVLKGSGSLIARPDGQIALCPWGNPGMACAGMGDVLTGVIAGLLAQGLDPWHAACLGVSLHARAGDYAAATAPRGLLASDLFAPLRQLVNDFTYE